MGDSLIQYFTYWKEVTDTYTQLAISALILPIIFLRQILGVKTDQSIKNHINNWLKASWALLSVSILLGIAHQLSATRVISNIILQENFLTPDPRILFKAFITLFYLGLVTFVIGAVKAYKKDEK